MDIDFHHAVTYIVGRIAGFNHQQARTVAHAAQYVDDATDEGIVRFNNGAMYRRMATAHRMLDYRNYAELSTRLVWIPFHFLPGNAGLGPHENPDGSFIEKLITRPNSPIAQEMVRASILDYKKPYALHRLGITAHVYVDTWAHQGFAGVNHRVNAVRDVKRNGETDERFRQKVARFFNGFLHQAVPPLGHGAALSYPDRPYLVWSYYNGRGELIERNNAEVFVDAADHLCRVFRRFLARDPDADVPGLTATVRDQLLTMLAGFREGSGQERHARWLDALRLGRFGFGKVDLKYVAKGRDSWRHEALGTAEGNDSIYTYSERFLRSDWKMFHDGVKAHHRTVVDEILPAYGIVVA